MDRSFRRAIRTPAVLARDQTLGLALLIVFPVVGLEQITHTSPAALAALPLYQSLHWISDSLLALPLATASVWAGQWLATRRGLGLSRVSDLFARACIIAVLLAVLLVPGQALHEQADRLTHSHALLAVHTHTVAAPGSSEDPLALAAQTGHALSDGLQGQAVGLPLTFLALLWATRGQRHSLVTRSAGAMTGRKVPQ